MNATLIQLRHFLLLAESGSFTLGAIRANRSQAAFSRSIAMLEAGLGVTLIDRVGHTNQVSLIGQTVLAHARQVVADADDLHQFVERQASGDAGRVRIGLGATPAALLMRPLLAFASDLRSGLRMELSYGLIDQQVQALRERRLDALVADMRSVPAAHDLDREPMAELPTALLCRTGHPLAAAAARAAIDVHQLTRYPIASTSISDEVARIMVSGFGPAASPSSLVSLCCEDVLSLLETVRGSDAVYMGILAPAIVFVQRGELVQLPVATTGLASRVAWVRRKGQTPSPTLTTLRDLAAMVLDVYAQGRVWVGRCSRAVATDHRRISQHHHLCGKAAPGAT